MSTILTFVLGWSIRSAILVGITLATGIVRSKAIIGRLRTILDENQDRRQANRRNSWATAFLFGTMSLTLAWSATPAQAKSNPVDTPAEKHPQSPPPDSRTLNNGAVFKVACIGTGNSDKQTAWNVDGTAPGTIPPGFKQEFRSPEPKDGMRTVNVCFEVLHTPRADWMTIDTVLLTHPLDIGSGTYHVTCMSDPGTIAKVVISARNSERIRIKGVHLYLAEVGK